MKKRIASIFLTILMICTMAFSVTVTADAATNSTKNNYLKIVNGSSADLVHNGIQYYHVNFLLHDLQPNVAVNYNAILSITCNEDPDPEDVWKPVFLHENGKYLKGIDQNIFAWMKKGDHYTYTMWLPINWPTGNISLYFTCNDEVVETIDFVSKARHINTESANTYVKIADETIQYGDDLHIIGSLWCKSGENRAPYYGNIDITLSNGNTYTFNLGELSGYCGNGKYEYAISGLKPGEYSITSAKFYGSDCYEDAEIPFSGTCVVEGNGLGSILSEGYPEIVFGVGGLAVGFFAAMLIFRKKKTAVSSASAENEE